MNSLNDEAASRGHFGGLIKNESISRHSHTILLFLFLNTRIRQHSRIPVFANETCLSFFSFFTCFFITLVRKTTLETNRNTK